MRELKEGNILLTVVSCVVIHFKKEPVLPGEMLEILEMVTYILSKSIINGVSQRLFLQ